VLRICSILRQLWILLIRILTYVKFSNYSEISPLVTSVADPFHFQTDQDPANQNSKNLIRIPDSDPDPTWPYLECIQTSKLLKCQSGLDPTGSETLLATLLHKNVTVFYLSNNVKFLNKWQCRQQRWSCQLQMNLMYRYPCLDMSRKKWSLQNRYGKMFRTYRILNCFDYLLLF